MLTVAACNVQALLQIAQDPRVQCILATQSWLLVRTRTSILFRQSSSIASRVVPEREAGHEQTSSGRGTVTH